MGTGIYVSSGALRSDEQVAGCRARAPPRLRRRGVVRTPLLARYNQNAPTRRYCNRLGRASINRSIVCVYVLPKAQSHDNGDNDTREGGPGNGGVQRRAAAVGEEGRALVGASLRLVCEKRARMDERWTRRSHGRKRIRRERSSRIFVVYGFGCSDRLGQLAGEGRRGGVHRRCARAQRQPCWFAAA